MPSVDLSGWGQGTEITASCIYTEMPCLTIDVVNDTLTKVLISLNYEMQATGAIESLGDPDYVGSRNLGAEEIWCDVELIWIDRQLVLASPMFKGLAEENKRCVPVRDTGKLPPDLPIGEVRYVSTAEIERLLQPSSDLFFRFSGMTPTK